MAQGSPLIRSKAPLRISFGGGGTDVPPYAEERGGCVINATIDKYAYCTIRPRDDKEITIRSLDYGVVANFAAGEKLFYDGNLDLVKSALNHFQVDRGLEMFVHSDAPPGSGLGSSSTVIVAIIAALADWLDQPMSYYEMAELAIQLERRDLGIQGGYQDQYAATFGGFNFIEFVNGETVVNTLRLPKFTREELEYRLLLVYTGKTRLSANIIKEQVSGFVERKESVVDALDETKQFAIKMKRALMLNKLDEFGSLLHEAWEAKKRFSTKMTDPKIDKLYEMARNLGATGGKILGAGGGGFLLVYCPFEEKHEIAKELREVGGEPVEFAFDPRGVRTWTVKE